MNEMKCKIKGDKPRWEEMKKRMEMKISRQRQKTVRERGGGNWFGIKICVLSQNEYRVS